MRHARLSQLIINNILSCSKGLNEILLSFIIGYAIAFLCDDLHKKAKHIYMYIQKPKRHVFTNDNTSTN